MNAEKERGVRILTGTRFKGAKPGLGLRGKWAVLDSEIMDAVEALKAAIAAHNADRIEVGSDIFVVVETRQEAESMLAAHLLVKHMKETVK